MVRVQVSAVITANLDQNLLQATFTHRGSLINEPQDKRIFCSSDLAACSARTPRMEAAVQVEHWSRPNLDWLERWLKSCVIV